MTDNTNDKLLLDFLSAAREQQIADNGFTETVMERVNAWHTEAETPMVSTEETKQKQLKLSRVWTLMCIVLGVGLFFVLHGWENIRIGLEVFLQTAPAELNPLTVIITFFVLCGVGVEEVMRREQFSL